MQWWRWVGSAGVLVLVAGAVAGGAQDTSRRGRKYKAPLPTSHIEVLVTKENSDKPIVNAAVIFRAVRNGKDDGNLEVKTDPDGKAVIDVIDTGSDVQVQVIAKGYATFADHYQVDEASRSIRVELQRPREQVSAYTDNDGKASTRKPGVQEPQKPAPPAAPAGGLQPRSATGAPAAGTGAASQQRNQGSSSSNNGAAGQQGNQGSSSSNNSSADAPKP